MSRVELPEPDDIAKKHSQQLISLVQKEIDRAGGAITFAEYMSLVLYAPGLGYYSAGPQKFGIGGDFVTAPEISPVFSQCLARQCQQVLGSIGPSGCLLEVGAGSGKMAAEILRELDKLGCLPDKYMILELSADLRQRQYELLKSSIPKLLDRVTWLDHLPAAFEGVVLANELLDAMPVHRISVDENKMPQELYVRCSGDRFESYLEASKDAVVCKKVKQLQSYFQSGYISEVNLAMEAWVASIAAVLKRGLLLVVDYGFGEKEYYHPQRTSGTLMCHYRHRCHDDPFLYPGLQDITAHVDFTALADCAFEVGFQVAGYNTQCYFLMGSGLGDIMAQSDPTDCENHIKLSQQVKLLTMPSEMGELFKVMGLTKGLDIPLHGFSMQDLRSNL